MGTLQKTRIIIPCYNESARLNPSAFLDVLDQAPHLSFLFVNDGSTDDTLNILTSIKEKNSHQVDVMNLDRNVGKAEAVRRGIVSALEGAYDYVGYWDADRAAPLTSIERFCRILERDAVDMVIGSRVRLLGRTIERQALRHYLGRVYATAASILLGIGIYDTQCGAKIFRNSSTLKQVFGKPFMVKWTFDVEMLARFPVVLQSSPSEVCSRWVEYPLERWVDVSGSKLKRIDYLKAGFELCRLWYLLRTPARDAYRHYLFTP